MDYDIVIATRNRSNALAMSLPLIFGQTILPRKLIIADASDNQGQTREAIDFTVPAGSPVEVIVLNSPVPGSASQRNLGLAHVTSPIVMMPDDDSLWYANTAEETLRIYDLDTNGAIAGVTAMPTTISPLHRTKEIYKQDKLRVLKSKIQPLRNAVEDYVFEPPFRNHARALWRHREIPHWIDSTRAELVEHIAGFRMSFRSDLVKSARFDELLGFRTGYALFEDTELSLRLQNQGGLLVSAPAAQVFHHVFPSKRANGFDYGFGQIANYIYVCAKLMPPQSTARRKLEPHLFYKLQSYRLRRDAYGRSVFRGATAAWQIRRHLLEASAEDLPNTFRSVCNSF